MKRRDALRRVGQGALLGASAAGLGLAGCARRDAGPRFDGGWVGASHDRGHLLRGDGPRTPPAGTAVTRQAAVIVVGGGVAGLACLRALRQRGIDDLALLELEDEAGGNSRGHQVAGMACPLGAHYLPVPDEHDEPLVALLEELGLSRRAHGRRVYEERHLCHSPQERLYIGSALAGRRPATLDDDRRADTPASADPDARWHDGLLPPIDALPEPQRAATLADYRRFAALVGEQVGRRAFAMPTWRVRWSEELAALDRLRFAQWLDQAGLHSPALRWYLDYCCRDDYGAGIAHVSAWAGLHYFASRHGFHGPGEVDDGAGDAVLTWPEGNAWLTRRLSAPAADQVHTGRTVTRVSADREGVDLDVLDHRLQRRERWRARQVVMATPLFIAARVIATPSAALAAAAQAMRYSPWLVGNLHLDAPLVDLPGAAPAWDNVVYGSAALGYVDAMHQSLRQQPGPTVLTAYWALGGDSDTALAQQRRALMDQPWAHWAERVVGDLLLPHPDLRRKLRRVDLMRYGHAMSLPAPGVRGHPALAALAAVGNARSDRIHIAHSDLSAYSVFEEAFFHGHRVGSTLRV